MGERMIPEPAEGPTAVTGGTWAEWGTRLERELWKLDHADSRPLRMVRSAAQLLALTIQGFQADQLLLRASALTYITAISVIPMLGVVMAILGLVGGDETVVMFAIEQLTQVAPEARETVRNYVSNINFASFGTVGGAILFATAIFALRHLEMTLNDIWGVTTSRSWARRFSDYLAVMVVGPISTGVAVSLGTTLQSEPALGYLLDEPLFARIYGLGLAQVPLLFLFAGFTFLYWFFPNTTVRIRSAALGGAVAALLFSGARAVYVDFQVGAATYEGVFGALSAIPLILVWLYACWCVLLLGAEVAFATQNLAFARREMRRGEASPAQREAVAVEIAVTIARRFGAGETPPSAGDLAETLDEPVRMVRRLVDEMLSAGILRSVWISDEQDEGFLPARPLADLTVGEVLHCVRGYVSEETRDPSSQDESVTAILARLEHAWSEVAGQTSLAELANTPNASDHSNASHPSNTSTASATRNAPEASENPDGA